MNKVVLTLLLSIFFVSTGIWVLTQNKSENLTDTGEPDILVEEFAETYVDSIEITFIENCSKKENVGDKDESKNLIVITEVETKKLIVDNTNTNAAGMAEIIETVSDSIRVNPLDDCAAVNNEHSVDNQEECKSLMVISESDTSEILTVNDNRNTCGAQEIVETNIDSVETNITDKYMSYYNEKSVDDESSLSDSSESLDDTSIVNIPERSWPDSNRIRRELTLEIAKKYPFGNFIPRKIVNNAWSVGEKLIFSIDYGFFHAGTATMAVVGTEKVNGGLCYQIRTTAASNKFISTFYKVRDTVRSFIDVEGIFSRRIEKMLREGRYKSDRFVDFYHDRLIALNTTEKYDLTEIPLYTQDILSSLYLLRTYDLEVGKDETIIAYADGKVYPLKVIVHKIENVKVPAGEFECFKVEPVLKSEGIFRQKGKLMIWLTNDGRKLPVKMTSKVFIGNIGSNLEKYSPGEIE